MSSKPENHRLREPQPRPRLGPTRDAVFFPGEVARLLRLKNTDSFCWDGPGWGSKRGFDYAHAAFNSKVEAVAGEPHELADLLGGQLFDFVLFLGVLYHLKDPLPALKSLRQLTSGTLILETEALMIGRQPYLRAFPANELNQDPTSWFAPNLPMLRALLLEAGFRNVSVRWARGRAVRVARFAWRSLRNVPGSRADHYFIDRVVIHAR